MRKKERERERESERERERGQMKGAVSIICFSFFLLVALALWQGVKVRLISRHKSYS